MRQLPLGVRLQDRAVLESFHPGHNAQAVTWLRRLLVPGGEGVGLFWGPPGAGKSHVLQGACAALPGSGYFPLGQLLALGPGVLEGAEELAILCIDDLQQVAGQAAWERALFRLYCEREARHGRLLLASALAPAQLPIRLPDLASRLAAAPGFALQPLDEAQQREALRSRAQLRGLDLPEEAALYLQRHYPRDMATLQGLLDQLDRASLSAQRRLTVPFIRDVLASASPRGA